MQGDSVHTGWSIENLSTAPRYAEEVEALIGTPFFPDEERSQALYDRDMNALRPEDIAARAGMYMQGLRVLAKMRAQERKAADPEVAETTAWNRDWLGTLTIKKVCAIAEQHKDAVAEIASAIESAEETGLEVDELYPLQEQYVDDTLAALSLPARRRRVRAVEGDNDRIFKVHGVNVIGPTGVGKTAIMGAIAHRLGIGKPHEHFPEREKRMLIVVPSDQLVKQIAGVVGDRTFTRFAKGLVPTMFYGPKKDLSGAVIVTTTHQYVEGFRNNHFFNVPIDVKTFDEAHHMTEPQVEYTFLNAWDGPTIGFTATPDYNEHKDVRSILPYTVEHIDLLESINQGLTNGAQLFSVLVECPEEELVELTLKEARQYVDRLRLKAQQEFLAPLIAEGRRAMVFCRPGKGAEQAKVMAELLSEIELSSDRNVIAETINSYNPGRGVSSNHNVVKRFHAGEIDALTTVRTALESFNADIDVVVFGDVYSFLKLRQLIGRGTRPSERFPTTIYAQFMVQRLGASGRVPYSVYQAFGLERIEQGVIFGPRSTRLGEKDADLSIFPPQLQQRMQGINHKKISDLLLTRALEYTPIDEIPEDYIPFDKVPIPYGMAASHAKYRLDTSGLTWLGTFIPGQRGLVRYYEPAARTFFIDHRMPAKGSPELHISVGDLAKRYNVAYDTMRRIIEKECKIPTIELRMRGNPGQYMRRAKIADLDAHMEKERPLRQPGDISAEDLAAETGTTYSFMWALSDRHKIKPKYRRRLSAQQDSSAHEQDQEIHEQELPESLYMYSKDEADVLRGIINAHPRADDTDEVKAWVMEKIGMTDMKRFTHALTDEEKTWLTPRWIHDKRDRLRLKDTWTQEQSGRIVQRFKDELTHVLPAHLLPSIAVTRFLDIESRHLLQKLKVGVSYRGQSQRIQLGIATTTKYVCLPWHLVHQLQTEGYTQSITLAISYDKLPAGPEDTDAERIAYARFVQAKLTPRTLLGFDPHPYLQK